MLETEETSGDFPSSMQGFDSDINWQRAILLIGKAVSSKSQAICHTVVKHVAKQQNILVAAPTGFLASRFRAVLLDEAICDTVHSVFHIPVDKSEKTSRNWSLSQYDILIIDEINDFRNKLSTYS